MDDVAGLGEVVPTFTLQKILIGEDIDPGMNAMCSLFGEYRGIC